MTKDEIKAKARECVPALVEGGSPAHIVACIETVLLEVARAVREEDAVIAESGWIPAPERAMAIRKRLKELS